VFPESDDRHALNFTDLNPTTGAGEVPGKRTLIRPPIPTPKGKAVVSYNLQARRILTF
jgi:hypothetical protein